MAEGRFTNPFSAVFTGVYDVLRKKDVIRDFHPKENLNNKTCLVTGANTGLGFGIAQLLADRGAHVIMACRSGIPEAGEKLKKRIPSAKFEMRKIDLTDVKSINSFIQGLVQDEIDLDVAIFNAGVTPPKARKTANGLDEMFMVNYLSKFYLLNKLLERKIIQKNTERIPRVIFISSDSHQKASDIEIEKLGVFEPYAGASRGVSLYSYYKLVLNTFAAELSRRVNPEDEINVSVQAVCPGPVNSDIIRDAPRALKAVLKLIFWLFFKAPIKAAEPVLYMAMAEELEGTTCQYLHMKNPKPMDPKVYDEKVGKYLWKKSNELIDSYYI